MKTAQLFQKKNSGSMGLKRRRKMEALTTESEVDTSRDNRS